MNVCKSAISGANGMASSEAFVVHLPEKPEMVDSYPTENVRTNQKSNKSSKKPPFFRLP